MRFYCTALVNKRPKRVRIWAYTHSLQDGVIMIAEEWVSLIGYRKANKLFLRYGGRSIHIPKKPKPEHPIALLLGFETLQKLSDQYATELLFVPRMNAVISDFKESLGIPKEPKKRQSTPKDSASEQTLIEFDQGDKKPKG